MPSELSIDELLLSSFDEAPFGMSLVARDGRIVRANARFLLMFGLDRLDGLDVLSLTRAADAEWTRTYLEQLFNGDVESYVTVKAYEMSTGEERLFQLVAWPVLRAGSVVAVIGVHQPVIEQPQLTDDRTRKLIQHIDNTISLIDVDGGLIETSGRYRPVMGYPSEFWRDRTIFDILIPTDIERVLNMRAAVLAEPGHEVSGEFTVLAADGTHQPLQVHAVNLLHDPDVRGIVITSRNVSEERALMRELTRRIESAEAEAKLRSRLMATVSHELRNPLHAMSGLAELLSSSGLPDEQSQMAATLHRQLTGLSAVIDDLLDSSRIDAAGITLRTSGVALRLLLDDILALASPSIGDRRVVVSHDIDPSVPAVIEADASRLRQVLSNLVGNALKFTEAGSVQVHVDVSADGMLRFVIADTGRGIPAGDLDAIFEPFATAGNSGTSTGAGLGLTIVRQLVGLMKGHVSATSTLGRGSAFTVLLPLRAARFVDDAPRQVGGAVVSGSVLVVEDNDVNQMLARSQLARLGVECHVVGTGEEALDVMGRPDAPDVVLMDFQLPGIDGLETTRRIRAMEHDDSERCIIIGVTASAMAADRAACREAGMDDFLAKPVSLGQLQSMLEQWMPARHVAPAPAEVDIEVVDPDVLTRLVDELDLGTIEQLVFAYLSDLSARASSLEAAARAGDLGASRRTAHTLKSTSLMVGAMALGSLCRDIERLDDSASVEAASTKVVELAVATDAELRSWLADVAGVAS